MYRYGNESKLIASQAHPTLQSIFFDAIEIMDIKLLCSHRDKEDQTEAFESGNSKTEWPFSKHNRLPSHAIDATPWPIPKNWGEDDPRELAKFYMLNGVIQTLAVKYDVKIRWGGDWDGDNEYNDQTFHDLLHWELVG